MTVRRYDAVPLARRPLLAYLLAPILVALTTAILGNIQFRLMSQANGFIRPFDVAYVLPIMIVTAIGGKRPAAFTLLLSIAAAEIFLIDSHTHHMKGVARQASNIELFILALVGMIVATGIDAMRENALAYREARERAAQAGVVSRVEFALRTLPDPAQMQETAIRELGNLLRADRCYFATFDIPRNILNVTAEFKREDLRTMLGEFMVTDMHIAPDELFPDKTTIIVPDIEISSFPNPLKAALRGLRIRSLLAIPFYEDGLLAAAITVTMADEPREWQEREIHLVQDISERLRSAVAQARLRQRERLVAATLQEALLPDHAEHVPGLDVAPFYRPALEEASVGGDYYDIVLLREGQYALVIGDISGKGLSAAVEAATVRNMLRVLLFEWGTVAEAVSRLNDLIVQQNVLNGFTTLFVGVYDQTTRVLTYVSCGHEPGLLRRAAARREGYPWVESLGPTGPILGAATGAVFREAQVTLAPGDILAIYTDGVTDVGPDFNELLGAHGLETIMAAVTPPLLTDMDGEPEPELRTAGQLLDTLLREIQRTTHAPLRDDACMLVGVVLSDPDAVIREIVRGTRRQGLL
jgi:serine phosphatase RsbU (regulator of sigma subunit)